MTSIELFQKGGPVMYVLLICSLSVAAIALERFFFYKRAQKGANELLSQLEGLMAKGKGAALEAIGNEDNLVAYLAKAFLKAGDSKRSASVALESAYSEAALLLRERLNYLSTIVTMAPLLGLLGTISGMIQSFSVFNLQAGEPMAITGGIGEALIATATGIGVAIFALLVHTYFAQRMDVLLTLLEKAATVLEADGGEAYEGK